MNAITPPTETAPFVESALPSSVSFVFNTIPALLAIIVPLIVVPEARFTSPSTIQNTLHASPPFINITFALAPVAKDPSICKINTALGLPYGTTGQRPANPLNGYLRYNTSYSTLEVYSNGGWITIGNEITSQLINCDGVNASFTLNKATTPEGIFVSINGTVQRPGVAYTVSGSTITFSEVPLITDIVDVRFIATAVSTSLDFEIISKLQHCCGVLKTENSPVERYSSSSTGEPVT